VATPPVSCRRRHLSAIAQAPPPFHRSASLARNAATPFNTFLQRLAMPFQRFAQALLLCNEVSSE